MTKRQVFAGIKTKPIKANFKPNKAKTKPIQSQNKANFWLAPRPVLGVKECKKNMAQGRERSGMEKIIESRLI